MSAPQLLLVDDDPVFCRVLGRALEQRGYAVHGVLDADAALRLADEVAFDHAVVDLRLGESSGLPLVAALRRQRPELRILVLTGYASIATAVEAIKLGAVHYLAKPADADEVIAALHRDAPEPAVAVAENPMSVNRLAWEHLQKVLSECSGNISEAARRLNMHRRTLQRKLQKHPPKL